MPDIYEDYGDVEFDVNDVTTWPVLVIGTSVDAGRQYAEVVGIKNYVVACDIAQIQGRRMRSVVLTPGYFTQVINASYDEANKFHAADQSWSFVPQGFYHRG